MSKYKMPKYKKIYIYRDSHLPEDGWIQSCFNCYTYTSGTIDYTTIKRKNTIYECNVFLCPECDKTLHKIENMDKQERFRSKCDRYIKRLFPG